MNLIERLLMRRLFAEAADGGDAGGGAAAPADAATPPAASDAPTTEHADASAGAEADKPGAEKPDGEEKPGDEKGDKDGKDKPDGAPEKYEFQAPEGVELDTEALTLFEPIAKELNLSQEQAQKLVDIYPKLQQHQADVWGKQVEQWGADTKADKEIGGDKFETNLGLAQKALDTFGTPELRQFIDSTGMGNHPEVIRAFMKVGKMMSEDSFVMPNNSGGQLSAAEVLYGKK